MHVGMKISTMWAYGHHLRVESSYHGKLTCECGVPISFDQTSSASSRDTTE